MHLSDKGMGLPVDRSPSKTIQFYCWK